MEVLISKLTNYEVFINLFPGTLFYFFMKQILKINIIEDSLFVLVFVCYFLGLVLSRIGSLIIEPFFRKIKKSAFRSHEKYIEAENKENNPKTSLKVYDEKNSIYRTLIATFFVMSIFYIIFSFYIINFNIFLFIVLFLLVILFSFSYLKQSNYISKRIDKLLN